MNNQYVIINRTKIEKRIKELEHKMSKINRLIDRPSAMYIKGVVTELKNILVKSTPLVPEIDKAFDAGIEFITDDSDFPMGDAKKKDFLSKEEYISNLKLDI